MAEFVEEVEQGARTQAAFKLAAQEILMDQVSVALGYWSEREAELYEKLTEKQRERFSAMLQKQADRIAKIMGYDEAWSS